MHESDKIERILKDINENLPEGEQYVWSHQVKYKSGEPLHFVAAATSTPGYALVYTSNQQRWTILAVWQSSGIATTPYFRPRIQKRWTKVHFV